jgi:lipoyl(octanoyl) transferase
MSLMIRRLGLQEYVPTYEAMKTFTASRQEDTPDEIWLLQHPPVYTLGQAGDKAHLIRPNQIQLVPIDRGGQITYHGPGQLVVYLLLDLRRRRLFVRELVHRIEQSIIDTLADYSVSSQRQAGAPGIYLTDDKKHLQWAGAKIAALGLKVTRQCCYHGLSLNVDMDLSPFGDINPCGYEGLKTIDMASLGVRDNIDIVGESLLKHLTAQLETTL